MEDDDKNESNLGQDVYHGHNQFNAINDEVAKDSFQELFQEYMAKIQKRKAITMGVASALMTFVTAPMLTLSTSLQLSILSFRKSHNDFKSTPDMKNMRLLGGDFIAGKGEGASNAAKIQTLKAKMVNLPFRPPAYNGYLECSHGLFKQGMMSFYKGNGIRGTHIILFQYLRTDLSLRVDEYTDGNFGKNLPFLKEFMIATVADFILHPLHLAESRFILQNRQMNFAEYPSIFTFFRQGYGEMWRGVLLHGPRNLGLALSGVSYFNSIDYRLFYLQNLGMLVAAYPFLTIQRRIEGQTRNRTSLLPQLYKNSYDAAKQIIKKEGFRAFYKGFTLHCLAIGIWISTVPALAQLSILNSPWADRDTRDIKFKNEEAFEEYEDELDDIKDEDLRAALKNKN